MQHIPNDQFYSAFIGGANEVMLQRSLLNEINVYPVPDGDTGNNLYNMMQAIITHSEIKNSIGETLSSIADAAIIGARGNSGAIFSQYIQGLSIEKIKDMTFSKELFILAAEHGTHYAYEAVNQPVEGTILTAMRIFHEALKKYNDEKISLIEMLESAYQDVEQSVIATTNQLMCLKKAAVVDSGAKGFALFIKGFILGLKEKTLNPMYREHQTILPQLSREDHPMVEPPTKRFCTEALIRKPAYDETDLKALLAPMGDDLVVSKGSHFSRIHIHTNNATQVMKVIADQFEIIDQKVDDMLSQYNSIHQRRYKTAIVTDSIADLPQTMVDDEAVVIIPLTILIGDTRYIDRRSINNTVLFEHVSRAKYRPSSSQPVQETIERYFETLSKQYQDIVVITVSKEMSGTYNAFQNAAKPYSNQIYLVDSKQNSVTQGLLVMAAIDMRHKGLGAKEISKALKHLSSKSKIMVSVKNLDSMIASGRLSTRVGRIGNLIKLSPIITIDSNGIGAIDKIAIGGKRRFNKMLSYMAKVHDKIGIEAFAVIYIDDKTEAIKFAKAAEARLGIKCEYLMESSSVIALNAGSGAFAVGYIRK